MGAIKPWMEESLSGRGCLPGYNGLYQFDYFCSEADAKEWSATHGGWITHVYGTIWRVSRETQGESR